MLTSTDGKLAVFASQAAVRQFCTERALAFEAEPPILHDLDPLADWLRQPLGATIEADDALCLWNLFQDVSDSTCDDPRAFAAASASHHDVYGKVFAASPVSDLIRSGVGPHVLADAHLTEQEERILHTILHAGMVMFRSNLGDPTA